MASLTDKKADRAHTHGGGGGGCTIMQTEMSTGAQQAYTYLSMLGNSQDAYCILM